jgi:hypothetical protein
MILELFKIVRSLVPRSKKKTTPTLFIISFFFAPIVLRIDAKKMNVFP